jgi:hypothetical protein
MKNKKKVQELINRLERWGSGRADQEFEYILKEIKKTVESEDEDGSNPPAPPPGNKPPGK